MENALDTARLFLNWGGAFALQEAINEVGPNEALEGVLQDLRTGQFPWSDSTLQQYAREYP